MRSKNLIAAVLIGCMVLSCKRKEDIFTSDPNARLTFSAPEVYFDTLYSGLSYPSQVIKVYNRNSEALAIDQVFLNGGVSSYYNILVNGQSGPLISGLELLGGDSMLVFISLLFPAQNNANPYPLDDFIRFRFNGQEQDLPLKAVGKDALLVQSGDIACGQIWDSQKTVILLGETVVPSGCTLTIKDGTKVLSKAGASLDVKGTLLVTGLKATPVYIGSVAAGKNPGQWKGIRFYEGSAGNNLSWLYIANAESGLSFASATSASLVDIELDHAILYDFTEHAIDLSFSTLNASNCLFDASANTLTNFTIAGSYSFLHCTWSGNSYDYYRNGPCVQTSNVTGTLNVTINNSIVWGDKTDELDFSSSTTATVDNSILKASATIPGVNQFLNQDPLFVSVFNRDFELQSTSPAIDKGVASSVTDDLKGVTRDALPDLGCYEYKP